MCTAHVCVCVPTGFSSFELGVVLSASLEGVVIPSILSERSDSIEGITTPSKLADNTTPSSKDENPVGTHTHTCAVHTSFLHRLSRASYT